MHANSTFHRQNPSQKQTFRNTLTAVILLKINLENSENSLQQYKISWGWKLNRTFVAACSKRLLGQLHKLLTIKYLCN